MGRCGERVGVQKDGGRKASFLGDGECQFVVEGAVVEDGGFALAGFGDECRNFSCRSISGFWAGACEQSVGDREVIARGQPAEVVVIGNKDAPFCRNGCERLVGPLIKVFQLFLIGKGIGAIICGVCRIHDGQFFGQLVGHADHQNGIHPQVGIVGGGTGCAMGVFVMIGVFMGILRR